MPVEDLIRSAAGQLSLEMRDTPVEGERMLGVELQEAASATLAGYREAAVQVPEVSPIDVEAFQNLRDSSYAPLRKRFCEFLRAARQGEGLFRSAPVPPQKGNKECSVEGCAQQHAANGYCELHDRCDRNGTDMHKPIQVAREKNVPLTLAWLLAQTKDADPQLPSTGSRCKLWARAQNRDDCGHLELDGRPKLAHRVLGCWHTAAIHLACPRP